MSSAVSCGDFEADVAELALGQVAEPARSALLDHAGTCAACSTLLAELGEVGDRLLHLAPEIEPPAGFEQRVLGAPPRRRRWRRVAVGAAAAAAVVVVAVVLAAGDTGTTYATILAADGEPVGTVEVADGRMVVAMEGDHDWDGVWTCEVRTADGEWVSVGAWTADEVRDDAVTFELDDELASASAMRILGDSGEVIATAALAG